MSRCFPFPPPGYESKNRLDDLDILKEAKRKEKKHKKEKKDNERKKDKKKDGSDDKQRDKKNRNEKHKDKQEKHKDKDKKKNRSKDKEKTSTSVESTVSAKLDEKSGEGLHPKSHSKPKKSAVHEGGDPFLFQTPSQSTLHSISKETDVSKFVQELDRRIRDDKDRKIQLPERIPTLHNRDQETPARAAVSTSSYKILSQEMVNTKDNRVNCAKMDLDRFRNEFDRSTMAQNLTPVAESKVEEFPRPPERHNEWRLEGKEKYKETSESKGKDKKNGDKESHGKEKVKEKEKKEKAKVKSDRDMSKVIGRNDFVGVINSSKSKDSLKDVNRSTELNIRKRKDIDTNGFLPEIKASPNKRQRTTPQESTENGSKPEEASRTPGKSSYNKPSVHNHIHADKKEGLINGIITQGKKPSPPSKPNPSPTPTVVTDRVEKPLRESISSNVIVEGQIVEASKRRPPHPDAQYLPDVLSVPTVINMSENDDGQEWLFSKKFPSDKRVGAKEELHVWSEAVHIESVDVCALPYVIPY